MPRTFTLRTYVLALAFGLVMLVGGLLTVVGQHLHRSVDDALAADLWQRVGMQVQASLHELILPADMALQLLQATELKDASGLQQRLQYLPAIRAALDASSALSSMYVGYGDGSFFFVRRLDRPSDRHRFQAPPAAVYLVQSIALQNGQLHGSYLFFDRALTLVSVLERPNYHHEFDPRHRAWYRLAPSDGQLLITPPYTYFSDGQVGITLARRLTDSAVVLAADIRLRTLGDVLAEQRITPGTHLALVDATGQVMALDDEMHPKTSVVDARDRPGPMHLTDTLHPALSATGALIAIAQDAPERQATKTMAIAGENWLVNIAALNTRSPDPPFVVMATPEHELMAATRQQRNANLTITLLVLIVAVPLVWQLAHQIAHPLHSIAQSAEAIQRFNFAAVGVPATRIREVAVLGAAMDEMRHTIRRFMELNTAVAGDADFEHLLPRLLSETLAATYARAGVLYLSVDGQLTPAIALDAQGQPLADTQLWDDSGKWSAAAADGKLAKVAAVLDLLTPAVGAALAAHTVQTTQIPPDRLQLLGLSSAASNQPAHAVAVPLENRQGAPVGAMLLILDAPADDNRLAFIGALSGLAAVSLEARNLITDQKALFDALLRMMASAIDAKSPHTGGHCARVPELVHLLAQATCDATQGPYANFTLSEDDWDTLRIAAWMHDCGKITTPEHVVDKGTKLHCLYDRIHEVRMRFELLKREAEIRCLQAILDDADPQASTQARDAELAALDADFAFVARCNQGTESMDPIHIERLQRIAARTWTRTLDDRLGLSHEELARKAPYPAPSLPHAEPLLANRPEHRIAQREEHALYEHADNPWGFRMQAPKSHLDMGELHNLSVRHGTLTEEERYLIRHHIVQTEIMLRQLPFPRHLAAVPDVAAAHHERMDGKGYPKGLTAAQLSPMARMMAIADVFEALTAGDRPYKRGKSLSEALSIMTDMACSGHLDPDLFAIFLQSGAYLTYAQRFVAPPQIDACDVQPLLERLHPA